MCAATATITRSVGAERRRTHDICGDFPAQAPDGLDPAEQFFDAFPLDVADAMAGMPGRARIDRRAAFGVVLRNVRGAAAFTTADAKSAGFFQILLSTEHWADR